MQKTYQLKSKEIKREIHKIDAENKILGRLASQIAIFLMGKNKTDYSPNIDSGDFVEVSNAAKVLLTGKKREQKLYRRHSGYPGGFKEVSFKKMIKERPGRVLQIAVSGMLPDNKLKAKRMARLKIVKS